MMESVEVDGNVQSTTQNGENSFLLPNGQNIGDLSLAEILLLPPDWIPAAPRGRPRKGTVEEYLGKKNVYKMLKSPQYRNASKASKTNSVVVISRTKHSRYRDTWCNDPTYLYVTSLPKSCFAGFLPSPTNSMYPNTHLSSWLHVKEINIDFLPVEVTINENTLNKISIPPFTCASCPSGSIQLNTCGPISCIQPILTSTQVKAREDWLVIGTTRIGWPSLTDPSNIDYEYKQNETYFGKRFDSQERFWTLSNTDMFASDFIRPINHCHYRHSNLLEMWHKSDTSWKIAYFVGLQDSGHIVSIHPIETPIQNCQERVVALVQGNGDVSILSLPLITYDAVNGLDFVVIPAESLLLTSLSASCMQSGNEEYSVWITSFAWFPGSMFRCVTGMSDGSVWIWDTSLDFASLTATNAARENTKKPAAKVLLKLCDASGVDVRVSVISAVSSLEFCPYPLQQNSSTNNLLAVGSLDGFIRLWQLPPCEIPVPTNADFSLSSLQPSLLMSFNMCTNIQKLSWDATGHGLYYTCSDTSEVHWLKLWSTISTKRQYILPSHESLKATVCNSVVPNGRTLSMTMISNAFEHQQNNDGNDNPHNYYATDGIPYVYTASSDGCIRGGFVPTLLMSKDPSEDGFVHMQVTNAVYDAEQKLGKLSLNFEFNLSLQKMARFGDDNSNSNMAMDVDNDASGADEEEEDDDDYDDFDNKKKKKKRPKKTTKSVTKPKQVKDNAMKGKRDIWYDSRVIIPVVTTLPPNEKYFEHLVICGLQCGIVLFLPPQSVVDIYHIQPSHKRNTNQNIMPISQGKRKTPTRNMKDSSKRKSYESDSDSEDLPSMDDEEEEEEEDEED